MLNPIKGYIGKLVNEHNLSDDDIYLYLVLLVSTTFAGIMHVILFFVMLVIGVNFLAAVNILSIIIYSYAVARLVNKKHYKSAGIIIAAEVIFYMLAVSYYIGTGYYVILYYFVLLFLQLTIPYDYIKTRILVSVAIWISIVASLLIGEYHTPVQSILSPQSGTLLLMTNVNLSFLGVVIELLSSNAIRTIIANSNTVRLEQYKNQANTDSLTGLYNRRYATDFFNSIIKKNLDASWCVAMLDIDDFKHINDTLGHLAGDEVLRNLSATLKKRLRKTDSLFRWGGEEFLLFLFDVEFESAVKILDKISEQIANTPLAYGQNAINITVTMGVSPLDTDNIEASIELCDKRLYCGKNLGKNTIVFCDA